MSVRCGERDVRIEVLIDPFTNSDLTIGVRQEHRLHYAPSYLEVREFALSRCLLGPAAVMCLEGFSPIVGFPSLSLLPSP